MVDTRPADSANDTTNVYLSVYIRKFIELVSREQGWET